MAVYSFKLTALKFSLFRFSNPVRLNKLRLFGQKSPQKLTERNRLCSKRGHPVCSKTGVGPGPLGRLNNAGRPSARNVRSLAAGTDRRSGHHSWSSARRCQSSHLWPGRWDGHSWIWGNNDFAVSLISSRGSWTQRWKDFNPIAKHGVISVKFVCQWNTMSLPLWKCQRSSH